MHAPEPDAGQDASFRAALDGYLHAIQDVAETVLAVHPEIGAPFHEQLLRLHARLAFQADTKTLDESRTTLHEALAAFSARARRYAEALTHELNRTLALVAQSEGSRSVQYVAHLVDFTDQMEEAVRAGDLPRLSEQANDLRRFSESIQIDTRDDYVKLREKLGEFQVRLRDAERLASLDPLTGLPNRRDFDRQLAARIAQGRDFCVLLFDLNNFKDVNDTHGHLCGDELLKQVGARLAAQVRPGDFVCRWGGDEFAAILDCGLAPALNRSRQIAETLNSPFSPTVDSATREMRVSVTVGVAQYAHGETPEELFQRVDTSMYVQKKGSPE